jgi:hypothetical protein
MMHVKIIWSMAAQGCKRIYSYLITNGWELFYFVEIRNPLACYLNHSSFLSLYCRILGSNITWKMVDLLLRE